MNWNRPRLSPRAKIGAGAFVLLAVGAAGGAGAMSLTRPAVEMAPVVPVAIARLPQADGVVTVRGRIAQVYGDHFVLNDGTGNALVDTGRTPDNAVQAGRTMTVQGHYNNGTLRASYLVNPQGQIAQVLRQMFERGLHGGVEHRAQLMTIAVIVFPDAGPGRLGVDFAVLRSAYPRLPVWMRLARVVDRDRPAKHIGQFRGQIELFRHVRRHQRRPAMMFVKRLVMTGNRGVFIGVVRTGRSLHP